MWRQVLVCISLVWEVIVQASPTASPQHQQVCLTSFARQLSVLNDGVAAYGIDGNPDTCAMIGLHTEPWYRVEFERTCLVHRVEILVISPTICVREYDMYVQLSNQTKRWGYQEIEASFFSEHIHVHSECNDVAELSIRNPQPAMHLQFTFKGREALLLQICEVYVY